MISEHDVVFQTTLISIPLFDASFTNPMTQVYDSIKTIHLVAQTSGIPVNIAMLHRNVSFTLNDRGDHFNHGAVAELVFYLDQCGLTTCQLITDNPERIWLIYHIKKHLLQTLAKLPAYDTIGWSQTLALMLPHNVCVGKSSMTQGKEKDMLIGVWRAGSEPVTVPDPYHHLTRRKPFGSPYDIRTLEMS